MSVQAQEYTWEIEQGETEVLTVPVADDGEDLTVTGWTVDAKIRVNPGGPLLYTFPAELVEASGTNVVLRVPADVSAAWSFTLGWFRVKITDPASPVDEPVRYRVLQGPVLVHPD